jgi:hypothetical protein
MPLPMSRFATRQLSSLLPPSVHYYPQAAGVTGSTEDPATAALRLQAPQSLYNASYVDPSVRANEVAVFSVWRLDLNTSCVRVFRAL